MNLILSFNVNSQLSETKKLILWNIHRKLSTTMGFSLCKCKSASFLLSIQHNQM